MERCYGRIYKLVCNITGDTYYGSTRNSWEGRLAFHIKDCLRGRAACMSKQIIKNNNYIMERMEEGWFESKAALLWRERWYIENNKCINKLRPIVSPEERAMFKRIGEKNQITVNCYCGGKYKPYKLKDHRKRKGHIGWAHNFHQPRCCLPCI